MHSNERPFEGPDYRKFTLVTSVEAKTNEKSLNHRVVKCIESESRVGLPKAEVRVEKEAIV